MFSVRHPGSIATTPTLPSHFERSPPTPTQFTLQQDMDELDLSPVTRNTAHSRSGRFGNLSIIPPEPASPYSKAAHHRQASATAIAIAKNECRIDFQRKDVSLISQLLQVAADVSSARQKGVINEYTKVRCVPTESVIHTLIADLIKQPVRRAHTRVNSSIPISPGAHPRTPNSARHNYLSATEPNSASSPRRDSQAIFEIGKVNAVGEKGSWHVMSANISYPDHWCPPATLPLSPFHTDKNQHSEHEVIDWCISIFGADLITPVIQQRLLMLESAKWAAFLAPFAGDEYVTSIGRFLAVFVLIDDHIIEEAFNLGVTADDLKPFYQTCRYSIDRLHGNNTASDALLVDVQALSDRKNCPIIVACLRAWNELWDDYVRRGADVAWCNRMASTVEEYIVLGVREAYAAHAINEAAAHVNSSTEPFPAIMMPLTKFDHTSLHARVDADGKLNGMDVLEALARQRVATIGWPMLELQLERAAGLLIGEEVGELIAPLVQMSAILPAMVNELVGLARDLREGDNLMSANFSLIQRRLFACSLSSSIDFTLALHAVTIGAFDCLATKIISHPLVSGSSSLSVRLPVLIDRLRNAVRGYAHWHHFAARYKSVMAVDEAEQRCFIFPVHDSEDQVTRAQAIADTLQQYQEFAQTH